MGMERNSQIGIGSRVYLKNAICGEPGCVTGVTRGGKALVEWIDMPEIGRETEHRLDSLVLDEGFTVRQLDISFESQAA